MSGQSRGRLLISRRIDTNLVNRKQGGKRVAPVGASRDSLGTRGGTLFQALLRWVPHMGFVALTVAPQQLPLDQAQMVSGPLAYNRCGPPTDVNSVFLALLNSLSRTA